MNSEINVPQPKFETVDAPQKSDRGKTLMAYGSIIIGIIGLGLFFAPIPEIICGVGGLILSIIAKDKNASWFTDAVRRYGNYAAWLNIIWVCIELGLKFV